MNIRKRLLLVALFSFILVMSSLLVNPFASSNQHDIIAKDYTKTQTALDSNTCTIEGDKSTSSLNCANINPQTLGEKNFVDVDNSQESVIEQSGEQGPPEVLRDAKVALRQGRRSVGWRASVRRAAPAKASQIG